MEVVGSGLVGHGRFVRPQEYCAGTVHAVSIGRGYLNGLGVWSDSVNAYP